MRSPILVRPALRVRRLAALPALILAAAACTTATVQSDEGIGSVPGTVRLDTADAIPSGTMLSVRLDQAVGTEMNQVGDTFTASLAQDLVGPDGSVVVPAGSTVAGEVTNLKASKHVGDQAAIKVAFTQLRTPTGTYPMSAEVTETEVETQRDTGRAGTGALIGGAAGLGLGAIIGRSAGGAILGGLLGAGAGTAIALGTGRTEAVLPAGTVMNLRTTQRIELAAFPVS